MDICQRRSPEQSEHPTYRCNRGGFGRRLRCFCTRACRSHDRCECDKVRDGRSDSHSCLGAYDQAVIAWSVYAIGYLVQSGY